MPFPLPPSEPHIKMQGRSLGKVTILSRPHEAAIAQLATDLDTANRSASETLSRHQFEPIQNFNGSTDLAIVARVSREWQQMVSSAFREFKSNVVEFNTSDYAELTYEVTQAVGFRRSSTS